MTKHFLAIAGIVSASLAAATAADYTVHSFKRLFLSEHFWSEGATFGDFNKDGKMDVVSGPYWWEGPDFKTRHEFYPALPFDPLRYSDNFFAFSYDFNGDGWTDIFILG